MAVIVPNAAEIVLLKAALNHTAAQNQVLKLFTNNYTPVAGSTESDFTEAAGGGYTSKSLTGSSWTVTTNGSGEAEAVYAAQTFTFTGALTGTATVYGYFVVNSSSGLLLWAERFSSSYTPAVNGDAITFTPTFQLFSEN